MSAAPAAASAAQRGAGGGSPAADDTPAAPAAPAAPRGGEAPAASPAARYEALRSARAALRQRLASHDRWLAAARLATFVAAVGIATLGWLPGTSVAAAEGPPRAPMWSPAWALLPAIFFVALAWRHARILRALTRATRAEAHYARGLSRLAGRWRDEPEDGARFLSPGHLYAADLDVLGPGSLFQRLCTAESDAGKQWLARYLTELVPAAEARARQGAVRALCPRLDLREALAVCAPEEPGLGAAASAWLCDWARDASAPPSRARSGAGGMLSGAAFAALAWASLASGPTSLAWLALAGVAAFAWFHRERVIASLRAAEHAARELALLRDRLVHLAAQGVDDPKLRALQDQLRASGSDADRELAAFARRMELLDSARNLFFAPVAALALWRTQLSFSLERWRARTGPLIPRWVDAAGEFEALVAISAYAFERPDDVFPELVDEGPLFEGSDLAHPLLDLDAAVPNDIALDRQSPLWIVSGSNMSGKSTWMRTVGLHVVLASIGAPARARALRLSSLHLGASLRVNDSLAEGASRFYAEIRRLRQVLGLAEGEGHTLFLLDELLSGTNSHDRAQGAEALLQALLDRGSIGLTTTHDLSITRLATCLHPPARNLHFEDSLIEGELRFDYRLREGVVTRSNAIALMRAVGLPL